MPATWGGKREGAGRKPKFGKAGVSHARRPDHKARHPLHVTLRVRRDVPMLRELGLGAALGRSIRLASREAFRVIHFSIQPDHLHLVVEASDRNALSRGMRGLTIRSARAINRCLGRTGQVFPDRYHVRTLATPREVRHGIAYVLLNWGHHVEGGCGVDPYSSGRWFSGWKTPIADPGPDGPVRAPRTWLASVGWRRYGLVRLDEVPGKSGSIH